MAKRSTRFWDRIADRYSRQPISDEAAYQKKLDVTRQYLRPGMEVLELGCGTGSTAIAHAPYVKHILATDISARMIEIAEEKASAAGLENTSFQQAAVEDVDVADESVDAVLGLSLLHLLEDKDAALTRIHRMLKPGGVFVSNTACLGDKMPWFKLIAAPGRMLGLIPLVKVFKSDELRASLTAAGFEIDHEWRPDKGITHFIVAKKAA